MGNQQQQSKMDKIKQVYMKDKFNNHQSWSFLGSPINLSEEIFWHPRLVEVVKERYLVPPSKEPYNWGKGHRRSGLDLDGQYGQESN